MNVQKTELPGVLVIEPQVFGDNRGFFFESYTKSKFSEIGLDMEFIQDNHSLSVPKYTVRGIHFQKDPTAQGKLVRCIRGRILDYAIDLRKGSETYLKWVAVELSADNKRGAVHSPGLRPRLCDAGGELRGQLQGGQHLL